MKGKEELENLARKLVRSKDLEAFNEAKDTLGAIDWTRLQSFIRKEQDIYVMELFEKLKELRKEEKKLQAIHEEQIIQLRKLLDTQRKRNTPLYLIGEA